MSKIRAGVIGFGYWGANIVRNFVSHPGISSVMVADVDPKRAQLAKTKFPTVSVAPSVQDLLKSPDIDLVAIVTPVSSHFELAKTALENGKHVLIEKPLTHDSRCGAELVELAKKKSKVMMVDHTFVYTPAVRKIKSLISSGELGKLWYFDSVRINLGLFQHDVNVIWDLAVHDLAILLYTCGMKPSAVSAQGIAHTQSGLEDIAYITLHFNNDFMAHIHVNWLAPTKIRQVIFGGSEKMLLWDDLNPSERLRIYDRGISCVEVKPDPDSLARELIKYRSGDIWSPALDQGEALSNLTDNLISAIGTGAETPTSGQDGLDIVCILEACQKSIKSQGVRVPVAYGGLS